MKAHIILLNTCLMTSAACLGAGYLLAGFWLIVPVLLAVFLFWFYTRNKSAFVSASGLLLATVLFAAIGITIGLSPMLMLVACATALISWDLILFAQSMVEIPPLQTYASFERYHLHSLSIATFAGLLLAIISSSLNLHFPFIVIVLLVIMTLGGLMYSIQSIKL